MNILLYILRVLYRIRLWLLLIPFSVTMIVIVATASMERTYNVGTTVYTGIASGFNIESGSGTAVDWNTINNAMDNLINIIYAQTTLKRVSIRLYAQHLLHGDPDHDNNYITAAHYRALIKATPPDVLAMVKKGEPDSVLVNKLLAYEKPDKNNHVYGLFNWTHPHYSYEALSKLIVKRLSNSDMLDIRYSANDPGIAYNTLVILNEEFIDQYLLLRYDATNNVIDYFKEQLRITGAKLRAEEDELTAYCVANRIINYGEQTRHIAALGRDFEIRFEDVLLAKASSASLLEELDEHINERQKELLNHGQFLKFLHDISDYSTKILRIESFQNDETLDSRNIDLLKQYKDDLEKTENAFAEFTGPYMAHKFTKEGINSDDMVTEWLTQLLKYTKASAELEVMYQRREELNKQYEHFSPIGTTIKRLEREIEFTQNAYLNLLQNYNAALMRLKNLQMSSATLRILNPPIFPINPAPTARRLLVALAFIGSLVLVLAYFLILEILDHTLRDKTRTERLTSTKVLGAFPGLGKLKYRGYGKECARIATNYLSSAVLGHFDASKSTNIINIVSTEEGDGKNFLAKQLEEYWTSLGMNVRNITAEELQEQPKAYALARSVYDLFSSQGEDVIIVCHPAMKQSNVPTTLLEEGAVNLVAARADRVWKDTDQVLLDRLKEQTGQVPLYIYLTQAQRETVENFTGLLPPYSQARKLTYRLFQLGLTSVK